MTLEQQAKAFSGGTATYVSTATQYTPTGKVWRVSDPDGQLTITTYDDLDRTLQVTDGSGRTNGFTYDLAGQKLTEVHGIGSPDQATYATYTYSDNGLVKTIADANSNTTRYDYNGQLRLVRTAFPNPSTGTPNNADDEILTHDAPGNILTRQTRSGVTITMGYDALERMTSKAVPLWTNVPARNTAYSYDLTGRRLEVSDDWGHDLTWIYGDSVGRNTSHNIAGPQWSGTKTLAYQYDANSNRTELKWPETYKVDYTYDGLDRMDIVTEVNGSTSAQLANYDWDPLSRRTTLTYATGGSSMTWTYSDGADLTSLTNDLASTANDVTFNGTFDLAHRLTSETVTNAAYRWTGTTVGASTYAPDRLNRYATVAGASFTYDGNQNLTSDGTWAYGYDPENRLLGASKTGVAWTFAYDPLGRRVSKSQTAGGSAFGGYLNDGDNELGDYNASGTVLRRYLPGALIDDLVAVREGTSLTFFHTDKSGSTVAMSNAAGDLAEGPYSYDAYGAPSAVSGVRYKFTGRRFDQETGLYYYRARYYSPSYGRFVSVDPRGYEGGQNLYDYVGSDPVNKVDPFGEEPYHWYEKPLNAFYDSALDARRATFQSVVPGEPTASNEYGTRIFRDSQKGFIYPDLVRGNNAFVDTGRSAGPAWIAFKTGTWTWVREVGDSHSHTPNDCGEGCTNFSAGDIQTSRDDTKQASALANPAGRVTLYIPSWSAAGKADLKLPPGRYILTKDKDGHVQATSCAATTGSRINKC